MKIGGLELAALLGGILCLGCTSTRMDFHHLPPRELLRSVEPGVTTRSQVLRRLGPPEELRRPADFDRARLSTPQHRRILDERRVFGDDVYTYVAGRRLSDSFAILPFGPSLLRIARTRSLEERWRIEFDEAGVVSAVSHVDERESSR